MRERKKDKEWEREINGVKITCKKYFENTEKQSLIVDYDKIVR